MILPRLTTRPAFALGTLTLLVAMAIAASYPLLDPDEGRNAEVAREMAASGNLVIPSLAGMPYLDKPPGLFWMSAFALRALGHTPWAVRVPAALAAALTMVLVCQLAVGLGRPDLAWRAGVLLLSAPLFAILAAYVIFDMPLAACVTVVWTCLARESTGGASRRGRLAMFLAVGAGLLIKGPVMLAWAIGGSLSAAGLSRSRLPLRWLGWLPGWCVALALAGSWFTLACVQHPEYPHYAFIEETFERLGSASFHREQPVWFVPAVLAGGALPWSLTTPWTGRLTKTGRIAAGFVLFAAIFFTLSRSKLVTYLLPALPPLAWMAAEAWTDAARARRGAWCAAAFYFILAVMLALGAVWLPAPAALAVAHWRVILSLLASVLGAVAAVVVVLARRRPDLAFLIQGAFVSAVLVSGHPVLVAYASSQSGEALGRAILDVKPHARVVYDHCYSPGTDFVLGRTSNLVSQRGYETTSNYQIRYRATLLASGRWNALDHVPTSAEVVVCPRRDRARAPGMIEFYRDTRFAAWRKER